MWILNCTTQHGYLKYNTNSNTDWSSLEYNQIKNVKQISQKDEKPGEIPYKDNLIMFIIIRPDDTHMRQFTGSSIARVMASVKCSVITWTYSAFYQLDSQEHDSKCWIFYLTDFNPLRAKCFRGNINIYLHFVSFLHIGTTQVVEILLQIRQESTYST